MSEYKDEPSFSLNDFKKWMGKQRDKPTSRKSELIGLQIESKIGCKRLVKKIDPVEGTVKELSKEFYQQGGIILEVEDSNLLVEVDSGSFWVPRFFCRKVKNAS